MLTQSTIVLLLTLGAPNPGDELTDLLSSIHGISAQSNPTLRARASAVCADSATYLPLLSDWLDPQFFSSSQDPLMRLRADNAIQLAVNFCGKTGRDILATRLKETRTLRDAKLGAMKSLIKKGVKTQKQTRQVQALRRHVDELMLVERAGLFEFAAAKDPKLVGDLVPRINTDTELSLQMVQYFIAAAPRDKNIKAELQVLIKTTRRRTLQARIKHYLSM